MWFSFGHEYLLHIVDIVYSMNNGWAQCIALYVSCDSMRHTALLNPLYNLPQLPALVAAIRQGRRIEVSERDCESDRREGKVGS